MIRSNFRFLSVSAVLLAVCASVFAQSKAFDTSRMDTSVEACDNFFQYANGNWVRNTQIPAAYSRWGTFNILADNNQTVLKDVLENAVKTNAEKGSEAQLIGDYYTSCMDETAIEKAGAKPLKPFLNEIDKIKTAKDLDRQIALFHSSGVPVLFGFGSGADAKNSALNIANASQGGLSLPNRDFYTKDDPKAVETRAKFVEYATAMFKLLGDDAAAAKTNADTVLKIQMRLARASKSPVELRNPEARYNKKTLAELAAMTPNFSWTDYMAARGVPPVAEINVGQPAFFAEVNQMLSEIPVAEWKTYLRWMLLNASAVQLSKPFASENFNFYSKYLQGTKEQPPRWKRCVAATDGAVGEAVGKE